MFICLSWTNWPTIPSLPNCFPGCSARRRHDFPPALAEAVARYVAAAAAARCNPMNSAASPHRTARCSPPHCGGVGKLNCALPGTGGGDNYRAGCKLDNPLQAPDRLETGRGACRLRFSKPAIRLSARRGWPWTGPLARRRIKTAAADPGPPQRRRSGRGAETPYSGAGATGLEEAPREIAASVANGRGVLLIKTGCDSLAATSLRARRVQIGTENRQIPTRAPAARRLGAEAASRSAIFGTGVPVAAAIWPALTPRLRILPPEKE